MLPDRSASTTRKLPRVISIPQISGELLEIRSKSEQTVVINREHAEEIQEYLKLLDLVQEIDIVSLPNVNKKSFRTVISQPGMRYAQVNALVSSLLLDETFSGMSLPERNAVLKRI